MRGNDDFHIFGAHLRGEDEKFLYRFIAHGQAADGDGSAMNENIRTRIGAPLLPSMEEVEFVGVINFHRQVVMAVGIQLFDTVNAFRHLLVALAQFGTGHAAGGLDGIVADKTKLAVVSGP